MIVYVVYCVFDCMFVCFMFGEFFFVLSFGVCFEVCLALFGIFDKRRRRRYFIRRYGFLVLKFFELCYVFVCFLG